VKVSKVRTSESRRPATMRRNLGARVVWVLSSHLRALECLTPRVHWELVFDHREVAGAGAEPAIRAGGSGLLDACVAELAGAVDGLLAVNVPGLIDAELAEAMVSLRREQARLSAGLAELTAAFEARQVHRADDGSRSAIDWIAVHCRLPRPQVATEVRDARRLRSMPATRAAYRRGDISAAHVSSLCRLAGHPRAAAHFGDAEAHLVEVARTSRFDDWKLVCDHWRDAADPDGPEQRRGRDHQLRRFSIPVGLHGVGHPDGYLTLLATATVTGALESIERELFHADLAEARAIHGDDLTLDQLARTPAQRRHDALVEMAVRAMTAPVGGKRPAPLITVMVDYPTLAGRVCELAGTGTVVAPGDITELLARDDTLIERVVFDGPNRVRDISTARTFRGTLRRILQVMHRRCGHGTCYVPSQNCQGDHIVPWSEGGATTQTNGRPGCDFHNDWWYRHPQHRPPPPTLHLDPPDDDPPHRPRPAPAGAPDLRCDDGHTAVITQLPGPEPPHLRARSPTGS
jgi:hypothetical protein